MSTRAAKTGVEGDGEGGAFPPPPLDIAGKLALEKKKKEGADTDVL